jgi:hypothetical protein
MNVAASKGPTITQRSFAAAEWRLVTMGTMPPRDPDEEEDNDAEPDDDSQPPVVREPDEDE